MNIQGKTVLITPNHFQVNVCVFLQSNAEEDLT